MHETAAAAVGMWEPTSRCNLGAEHVLEFSGAHFASSRISRRPLLNADGRVRMQAQKQDHAAVAIQISLFCARPIRSTIMLLAALPS